MKRVNPKDFYVNLGEPKLAKLEFFSGCALECILDLIYQTTSLSWGTLQKKRYGYAKQNGLPYEQGIFSLEFEKCILADFSV